MADEEPIDDADELLHRQVHPTFLQNGRVSSQAFRPTPKDEGMLSVSRGSMTTAEDAYVLYTGDKGLESAGVWSVTVSECGTVDLKAFHDPLTDPVPDSAHSFVDFRDVGTSKAEKCSKRLAAFARARGCQHAPASAGD